MSNEWIAVIVVAIGLMVLVAALGPRRALFRQRRDEESVISVESFRPADRPEAETRHNWALNTGAMWTEEVQPLFVSIAGLIDHRRHVYLAAPRLSDFLSVDRRLRGDQAGVAMENRLRQNRVAWAFLDPETGQPQAAVLFKSHDNRVAIGAFEAVGLRYVVVPDTKMRTIKNALDQLQIATSAGSRPARRPMPPPKAAAASAKPNTAKTAAKSHDAEASKQPVEALPNAGIEDGLQTLAGLGAPQHNLK